VKGADSNSIAKIPGGVSIMTFANA